MYDLHCHLLPGVDDGADSMESALALVRAAIADGTTHAILTPHIHPGRYDNSLSQLLPVFQQFRAMVGEMPGEITPAISAAAQAPAQQADEKADEKADEQADEQANEPRAQAQQAGAGLQLALGAEVRLSDDLPALLEQGEIPFIGEWHGDPVLLLELPHSHIPPGSEHLLKWLGQRGVRTLIAHPERNRDVLRDLKRLRPLVQAGCLLQVTASAVAGDFGRGAQTRAHQLLKQNLVTVLASDAHHLRRRPPGLSRGRAAAAKVIGESRARELVLDNPRRLSQSRFVTSGLESPV
ncbi:tyrosine-protein phosphatase CpsB [Microbulbifer aestuariivivens]|uniref:protein-tyrosine-phosphatase n=1 Tax=Microbulbifer aestuariivivens TaxID=1908308 RepID=A0ABP9WQY9_9GAMM